MTSVALDEGATTHGDQRYAVGKPAGHLALRIAPSAEADLAAAEDAAAAFMTFLTSALRRRPPGHDDDRHWACCTWLS